MTLPAVRSSHLLVPHGFFGRQGGVSGGIYAALNAGPGSRDDPAAVAENRARIAAQFGVGPDRLLSLHQVHSARAVRVDGPWNGPRPEADALVTTTPGLVLTALSADCAPVLFAEVASGVVAAAHAGWKGALGGVLEACIALMADAGADPSRVVATIGPTIGPASYEVGPDFVDAFGAADARSTDFFRPGPGDRSFFDLPAYVEARLRRAGVEAIDRMYIDTYSETMRYFSHRRAVHRNEGDYGRNCAAICLGTSS